MAKDRMNEYKDRELEDAARFRRNQIMGSMFPRTDIPPEFDNRLSPSLADEFASSDS